MGKFERFLIGDGLNASERDREFVMELARDARERSGWNANVIEVGTYAGEQAIRFAEAGFKVFAVDTWKGGNDATQHVANVLTPKRLFQGFCSNMGAYLLSSVIPLHGKSLSWASVWPDHMKAAVIYIDANHDYECVKADIEAWWPHVAPGGILAGHDYSLFPGVTKAADEFGIDGSNGEVWWKEKPHATDRQSATPVCASVSGCGGG